MPPVRSVQIDGDLLTISDKNGVTTLSAAMVPAALKNLATVENWINTVWIPAHFPDYQVQAHVVSLSPLVVNVWTGNNGVPIPAQWWND